MRISIFPRSHSGRWSVGLAATFLLAFLLISIIGKMGAPNLGQAGPILGIGFGIIGTSASITGLISIIINREYSVFVFLAILVGSYALLFVIFLFWLTFLGGSLFQLKF